MNEIPFINVTLLDCADIDVRTADGAHLTMLGSLQYLAAISAVELRAWRTGLDAEGRPEMPTLVELVTRSPLLVSARGRGSFHIHFEAMTWMPLAYDQTLKDREGQVVFEQLILRGARIDVRQ